MWTFCYEWESLFIKGDGIQDLISPFLLSLSLSLHFSYFHSVGKKRKEEKKKKVLLLASSSIGLLYKERPLIWVVNFITLKLYTNIVVYIFYPLISKLTLIIEEKDFDWGTTYFQEVSLDFYTWSHVIFFSSFFFRMSAYRSWAFTFKSVVRGTKSRG